jgi:hypothetical protein
MSAPATVLHKVKLAKSPANLHHCALPPLPADYRRWLKEREEESFERGRAQAEQGLAAQIVSQRQEMVQLQNGVLKAINDAVSQVVRDTERTLVEIALATASRLVSGLPISAEVVEAAIREALTQVEETANVPEQRFGTRGGRGLRPAAADFLAGSYAGRLRGAHSFWRGGCAA